MKIGIELGSNAIHGALILQELLKWTVIHLVFKYNIFLLMITHFNVKFTVRFDLEIDFNYI